ncbi:MAG: hypothetical protein ACRDQX_01520 [Pseudonocardiaceae bacterium]
MTALNAVPIVGPFLTVTEQAAGEALNHMQCVSLAQGLSMRPASSIPRTNAAAHTYPELKNMIEMSNPGQAQELGQLWNSLGNQIMEFGANLQNTAANSTAIWSGQAGDAARAALSSLATWSQHTGQGVQFMSTTVRTQAEAAHTAKTSMPEPLVPPYDPAQYRKQLNSTSDPAEWARIMSDSYQQANLQDTKHAEAVRVVDAYSASLRETNAAMPAFTPPPTFGDASTGHTPHVPRPAGRIGGAPPPVGGAGSPASGSPAPGSPAPGSPVSRSPVPASAHAGPAPGGTDAGVVPDSGHGNPVGTSVGGPGSNETTPAATTAQSVSYAPEIPGGGVPAGGSGAEPSFLPAAAAIGGSGLGGRGSSVGGGFGPRGSSGLGSRNPRTVSQPATTFDSDPDASAPKRGGAGGGLPLVPGSTPREKDAEHRRPSYLIETEDIWGDGLRVAPPVIGEDPPPYHY